MNLFIYKGNEDKIGVTGVTGLPDSLSDGNDSNTSVDSVTKKASFLLQDVTSKPEKKPPSDWKTLRNSNLTDLDVLDLTQAIFLFAVRKIEGSTGEELEEVREKYSKRWMNHLPAEAYREVKACFVEALEAAKKAIQEQGGSDEVPQGTAPYAGENGQSRIAFGQTT